MGKHSGDRNGHKPGTDPSKIAKPKDDGGGTHLGGGKHQGGGGKAALRSYTDLVEELAGSGLLDDTWRRVFTSVPRELLIPGWGLASPLGRIHRTGPQHPPPSSGPRRSTPTW